MRIAPLLLLFLILPILGPIQAAVPPYQVNYQGVLRSAANDPLTGTFDMVFRFYAPGDVLLLTDEHLASDTGGVTVTGGMFSTFLGGGRLVLGACSSLPQVFSDYGEVYLEVQVGAETLTPRTRIMSAPYAHNADNLDGLSSAAFSLTGHTHPGSAITSAVAQATNADTVDGVHASGLGQLSSINTWTNFNTFTKLPTGTGMSGGSLFVNPSSAGPNYTLFGVGVGAAEKFRVDAEGDAIATGSFIAVGASPRLRLENASGTALAQMFSSDDLNYTYLYDYQSSRYVLYSNSTGIGIGTNSPSTGFSVTVPSLRVNGTPGLNGYLYMDYDGPDSTQSIYFYDGASAFGEYLRWDDLNNRFVASNSLGTSGDLYVNVDGPEYLSYLYFYDGGSPTDEYLSWYEPGDNFVLSNDLFVQGSITGTGAKSFVQNHPYDPGRSVVYTALAGDEAGTYTRGSGRLVNGEARIALAETFALVTNPEIGLTAHVTPRGTWADLYVVSVDTTEIVVRSRDGAAEADFDYLVHGLRIGYEDFRVVQPRTVEARVPSEAYRARQRERLPDLARFTARERFTPRDRVRPGPARDAGAARALRAAIGEYDPDADNPGGMAPRDYVPRDGASTVGPRVVAEASAVAPAAASALAAPATHPSGAEGPAVSPAANWTALPVSESVEAGDVLVLDPEHPGMLRRASLAADRNVVGVVAGDATTVADHLEAPVSGYGFVMVRVDAGYGAIRAGDLLTTSSTPGHAMVAFETLPGTILGKAVESLESGTGRIRVLLMPR